MRVLCMWRVCVSVSVCVVCRQKISSHQYRLGFWVLFPNFAFLLRENPKHFNWKTNRNVYYWLVLPLRAPPTPSFLRRFSVVCSECPLFGVFHFSLHTHSHSPHSPNILLFLAGFRNHMLFRLKDEYSRIGVVHGTKVGDVVKESGSPAKWSKIFLHKFSNKFRNLRYFVLYSRAGSGPGVGNNQRFFTYSIRGIPRTRGLANGKNLSERLDRRKLGGRAVESNPSLFPPRVG